MYKKILYNVVICLTLFLFSCGVKPQVPQEIVELKNQIEKNPQNTQLAQVYVDKVLFFEQAQNAGKKDIALIDHAIDTAKTYLENTPNKYMQLDLARSQFQGASYYNAKKDIVRASAYLQDGMELFLSLVEMYSQDIFIRVNYLLNVLNLPKMFQDKQDIDKNIALFIQDVKNVRDANIQPQLLEERMSYLNIGNKSGITARYLNFAKAAIGIAMTYYKKEADMVEKLTKITNSLE